MLPYHIYMIKHIIIKTKKHKEVIDITNLVNENLSIKEGPCHIFALHTTTAVTTSDLDPGTDLDLLDAFINMVPKLPYRHPHNPAHAPDHILSSLVKSSLTLPVENGKLVLGMWQRVVLIEFDGPRDREIVVY